MKLFGFFLINIAIGFSSPIAAAPQRPECRGNGTIGQACQHQYTGTNREQVTDGIFENRRSRSHWFRVNLSHRGRLFMKILSKNESLDPPFSRRFRVDLYTERRPLKGASQKAGDVWLREMTPAIDGHSFGAYLRDTAPGSYLVKLTAVGGTSDEVPLILYQFISRFESNPESILACNGAGLAAQNPCYLGVLPRKGHEFGLWEIDGHLTGWSNRHNWLGFSVAHERKVEIKWQIHNRFDPANYAAQLLGDDGAVLSNLKFESSRNTFSQITSLDPGDYVLRLSLIKGEVSTNNTYTLSISADK